MVSERQLDFINKNEEVFNSNNRRLIMDTIFSIDEKELTYEEQASLALQVNELLDEPFKVVAIRYKITSIELTIGLVLDKSTTKNIYTVRAFASSKGLAEKISKDLEIPAELATKIANLPVTLIRK